MSLYLLRVFSGCCGVSVLIDVSIGIWLESASRSSRVLQSSIRCRSSCVAYTRSIVESIPPCLSASLVTVPARRHWSRPDFLMVSIRQSVWFVLLRGRSLFVHHGWCKLKSLITICSYVCVSLMASSMCGITLFPGMPLYC
jgi:hypothetical protein